MFATSTILLNTSHHHYIKTYNNNKTYTKLYFEAIFVQSTVHFCNNLCNFNLKNARYQKNISSMKVPSFYH